MHYLKIIPPCILFSFFMFAFISRGCNNISLSLVKKLLSGRLSSVFNPIAKARRKRVSRK
jgi:hypothetical protein